LVPQIIRFTTSGGFALRGFQLSVCDNLLKANTVRAFTYIEGMRDFQCIMCKTEKILASHSMQELCLMLDKGFVRCHKSYIVAVAKINSIERERIFIGNKSIPIGEMYREDFYKSI